MKIPFSDYFNFIFVDVKLINVTMQEINERVIKFICHKLSTEIDNLFQEKITIAMLGYFFTNGSTADMYRRIFRIVGSG